MSEPIAANIEKHGWDALHVFDAQGQRSDFSYSIGFEQTFGHPEIVIFGLRRDVAQTILSDIASHLVNGVRFEPYERLGNVLGPDLEVQFRPVRDHAFSEYLGRAVQFYGKPFRAWVMIWPDKEGRLPGEPGCKITSQDEAVSISS